MYTVDEYLELEEQSETKHEYIDGRILAMAGGEVTHGVIAGNVFAELRTALRGKPCRVFNSDIQTAISWSRYTYPDVSVVCGPLQFYEPNKRALNNAVLITEVLSDSTEKYDRGKKFQRYRQIPTFKEYALVSQTKPLLEVYYELEDNVWRMSTYESIDALVRFESIDVELPMRKIYLDVEFDLDSDAD